MTMKKKTLRLTLLFLILFSMLLPGVAYASDEKVPNYLDLDNQGLLTQAQGDALDAKLSEISLRHDFDVVVAVVYSVNGQDPRVYAADVFEYFDFGRGNGKNGGLLLIAMESRDYRFVTKSGYGESVFTYPAGQEYLHSFYVPYLSEGQYNDAFNAFANAADDFLTQAEAGNPYDKGNIPVSSEQKNQTYAICIIMSLIVGLIVALALKAQLKSVRKDAYARAYVREGSMYLRAQNDRFLYSSVSKTPRNNNNSGGGGGSFSSSSGGSFSGSGGKF